MNTDFKSAISEILELLSKEYTDSRGIIVQKDRQGNKHHLWNDLGDYLPFFAYLKAEKLCAPQLKHLSEHIENGLLKPTNTILGFGFNSPYEHSDLLLGLLDYHEIEKHPESLKNAKQITEAILKKFKLDEMKSSFYLPKLKLRLSLFDTIDGMYIELLMLMSKATGDKSYLTKSHKLADGFLELEFFKKNGLFPELVSPFMGLFPKQIKDRSRSIKIMKNNTNTLFGLLELYKESPKPELKEGIQSWIRSLKKNMQSPQGGIYGSAQITKNGIEIGPIELTPNFAALDFLCDANHTFKDEMILDFAKEIADYWLSVQGKTGLFPLYPESSDKGSYFDSETDMLVALRKLAELSGEEKYRLAADRVMQGILTHHRSEKGYFLKVDVDTGQPLSKIFKTKFISLFLKALILYDSREAKIYQNPRLFDLLKDR